MDQINTAKTTMKQYQVEAYMSVLLFCCLKWEYITRWDLSKICRLYDIAGDIFKHPFMKKPILDYDRLTTIDYNALRTNCRLVPDGEKEKLYNACLVILDGYSDTFSNEARKILVNELMPDHGNK